jgi:hypothetical protein
MAQRIKGQETEVIFIVDSVPKQNLTTIKDFDFEYELETKSEGYLGETTDRKDSVYKGVSGKMTLHIEGKEIFLFVQQVINKARRRTPGTKINIKTTLNFPSGEKVRVVIPDCEFGNFPFSFPSRTDYLSVTVNYVASDANAVVSA